MANKRNLLSRGMLLILTVVLSCLFIGGNIHAFALESTKDWLQPDKNSITSAQNMTSICYAMSESEKSNANIFQYKNYIAFNSNHSSYTPVENEDFIIDSSGNKLWAWQVSICNVGYDIPVSQVAGVGNNANTIFGFNNYKLSPNGVLLYLHRIPYEMTVFQPSRYTWYYIKNADGTTTDGIPANASNYSEMMRAVVNKNATFYGVKFTVGYTPVPHVLGSEGLVDYAGGSTNTYQENGKQYMAVALMDETNGEPVPVLLDLTAGETPFWNFRGNNLPASQSSYIAKGDSSFFDNNYWMFQTGFKDAADKITQPFVKLSDIIASDNVAKGDAYVVDSENVHKTKNVEDIYGATQYSFKLPTGNNVTIGSRGGLEKAIVAMKYPFLVSNISLAMDETITQRNSSVQFMTGMYSNFANGYSPNVTNYGQVKTGYGKARGAIGSFSSPSTLAKFYTQNSAYNTKNIILTLVKDDFGNHTYPKMYSETIKTKTYVDGEITTYNTYSFKTTGLTIVGGLGQKEMDAMAVNGDLSYVRMPWKVFSRTIVTEPYTFKIGNNTFDGFLNLYRDSSEVSGASSYVYGYNSFYSLGRYVANYENAPWNITDAIQTASNGYTNESKNLWDWDKQDDFGTWRYTGITPSGYGYYANFPYDTSNYTPWPSTSSEDALDSLFLYPWKSSDTGKLVSGYYYNKLFLENFADKSGIFNIDDNPCVKKGDMCKSENLNNIYKSMLDNFSNRVLMSPQTLMTIKTLVSRHGDFTHTDAGKNIGTNKNFIDRYYPIMSDEGLYNNFEKEYCRNLTMKLGGDGDGQVKNGLVHMNDPLLGNYTYDQACENGYPISSKTVNVTFTGDGYYKDSYSALINTWDKTAKCYDANGGSKTCYIKDGKDAEITYKEALAYLYYQFFSVDQLSSDLVIGRMTIFRDSNGKTARDRYFNQSVIHGEFANVYLLNEENRLNSLLTMGKENSGATKYFGSVMQNVTESLTGDPTKGEDAKVIEYLKNKEATEIQETTFANKFGPELYLVDNSTGSYSSDKDAQIKCPDGFTQQGNKCIFVTTVDAKPRCENNLKYNENTGFCEINTIEAAVCPGGYNLINGNCVRLAGTSATCASGDVYDETKGWCISTKNGSCPAGYSRDEKNDECVKTVDKGCPYGGEMLNGHCVSATDKFTGTFPEDAIKNFNYTGKVETIKLTPGTYKLEAWGAQGGGKAYVGNALNSTSAGGNGGYSSGLLTVTEDTTLYVYVGGAGGDTTNATTNSAFGGGGSAKGLDADNIASIGGGGGASDIRIGNNNNDYRVLVAGGGGGTLSFDGHTFYGGVGGGEIGGSAEDSYDYPFMAGNSAQPGTNNNAGTNGISQLMNATYGAGGSAKDVLSGAGGGGGWFGGAAGLSGAGGSGFAFDGVAPVPNTYKLPATYTLKEAVLKSGAETFLNPDGITSEGNTGNGYVRITKTDTANNSKYVCEHVEKDLLPGESVELRGAYIGQAYDFDYTGTCKTWVAPVAGTYYIEGWGASGGHSAAILDGGAGGKGGYSAGYVTLAQGEEVQICVGGAGQQGTNSTSVKAAGGFNGGGSSTALGGGGGGMTSVRAIDKTAGSSKIISWDMSSNINGWTNGNNVSVSYDSKERAMKYHINNANDPQAYTPTFTHSSAKSTDYVNIQFKSNDVVNIQVYFTGTSGTYSETNVLRLNNIAATGDNYTTVSMPASSIGWTGTVQRMRIDFDRSVGDVYIKEVSITNKPAGEYMLVAGGGGGGGIGAEYSEEIVDNTYKSTMLDDMSSQGNGTDYNAAVIQYATAGQKIQFKMGRYSTSATANMQYYIVYSTTSPTLGKNWAANLGALEQLQTGSISLSSIPNPWRSNFNNLIEVTTMTVPKTGYYTIYTNDPGGRTSSRSTYDVVLGSAVWTVLIHTDDSGIGGVGGGTSGGDSLKGVNVGVSGIGGSASKYNAIGVGANSAFGGAGGGGYYGGNGATFEGGGGGGSGFIGSMLTGANTWNGNSWFKSPTATYSQSLMSHEQGHTGNGYARITLTSAKTMDGKSTWTASSKGQHLTTEGSSTSFSGRSFYPDRTKTFNYCQIINPQDNVWIVDGEIIDGNTINNNNNNNIVDEYTTGKVFDYTGNVQPVTLEPGTYELEAWGAQGGKYGPDGGKGGYAKGTIILTEKTTLYVYVGEQGEAAQTSKFEFNGGAKAYDSFSSSGGGASDIRIVSGNWDDKTSLNSRILVAGGGGGSSQWGGQPSTGGVGGGLNGGKFSNSSYPNYLGSGNGGTQTGITSDGVGWMGAEAGFGYGGYGGSGCTAGSGGGGGWYGGTRGVVQGGGGGSGYVLTSVSHKPSGYNVATKYYLSNTTLKAGNESVPSPTGSGTITGKTGNGAVKITRIGGGNNNSANVGTPTTYSYTGYVQPVTLNPGTYKLEAWGASGGTGNTRYGSYVGGLGGYSNGIITLTETTTLYLYVGGKGTDASTNTNITIAGGFNGGGSSIGASGGGNGSGGGASDIRIGTDSLYARVLVAGGGGGGGTYTNIAGTGEGGAGGGSKGEDGHYNSNTIGAGGTEKTGYRFGVGQDSKSTSNVTAGAGGGGGWFGGFASALGNGIHNSGAGGGSGYVYTAENAQYTANSIIGGTWLLNNKYYLTNASTISGTEAMPKYTGSGTMLGNSGNGAIRITPLTISEGTGSKTFTYTGKTEKITLNPGRYTLEAWGAQGGYNTATASIAAKGGYSKGTLTLTSKTTLYIRAGGMGTAVTTANKLATGGFNGGGNAYSSNWGRGSGGGASDIRIGTDSLYARVLVAGGAGGNTGSADNMTAAITGGYGGGANAGNGTVISGAAGASYSTGGTLSAAGTNTKTAALSGSFGAGGNYSATESGGGGGWFGGAAGNTPGGGSGFVYTAENAQYTTSSIIGGTWLLNNKYYLSNSSMVAGNESMPDPNDSSKTITGNSGNGVVKITGNISGDFVCEKDDPNCKARPEIYDARIRYDKMCPIGYKTIGERCETRQSITCTSGYNWDTVEKKCKQNLKPSGCTNAGTLINIGGSGSSTRWACGYTSNLTCNTGFHLKGSSCVADVIPQEIPKFCFDGFTYDSVNKKCVHTEERELDTSSLTDDIKEAKPLTGDKMKVEVGQVYAFRNYIGYNPSFTRAMTNRNGDLTSSIFFPQVVTNIWLFKEDLAETGCLRSGGDDCDITAEKTAVQIPITLAPKKIISGNHPNIGLANSYDENVGAYLNRNQGIMLASYPRQSDDSAINGNNTYLASHLFAFYVSDDNQSYANTLYNKYALVEFVFKIEADGIYILNRDAEGHVKMQGVGLANEIDWDSATKISMEEVYRYARAVHADNLEYFFTVDDKTGAHNLKTLDENGEATIKSIAFVSAIDSFSPIDVSNIDALNAVVNTGADRLANDKALAMMLENSNTTDDTSAWVGGFGDALGDVYIDRLEIINEKGDVLRRYDAMTQDRCLNSTASGYTSAFSGIDYDTLTAGVTPTGCEMVMNVPKGLAPSIILSKDENYQVRIYTKYVNDKADNYDPKVNNHNLRIQQVMDSGSVDVTDFLTRIHDDQGYMNIYSGKVDRTNIINKQSAKFSYDMGWVPGEQTAFAANFNIADMTVNYFNTMLSGNNLKFTQNASPLIIPLKALTEKGETVREGSYAANIGDGSKGINNKKDWDNVKFSYSTGDVPDNSIEVFFECLNKNTNEWDKLTVQTGMCKRLDVKVYDTKCRTYAIVTREKLNNYDTDTKIEWVGSNQANANMDELTRTEREDVHILNVGDKVKILLEEFSSDLELTGQYHQAKAWIKLIDSNTANNVDYDCLNWGEKINYAVDSVIVNPERLKISDTPSTNRQLILEGQYQVSKVYDKDLQRDVNVTFEVSRADGGGGITCQTTSQACSYGGYNSPAYTKVTLVAPTVETPVYLTNCYKLACTINEKNFVDGDVIKVNVKINGGKGGQHNFTESYYEDNESAARFDIYEESGNKLIKKCDDECVESNSWDLLFDFVYDYESKVVDYNTTQNTYMSWTDYQVGGTNAVGGKAIKYTSPIGANASTTGQGNELRTPIDYLAFRSETITQKPLCTDYRNNNSQCWRYEMNATHTIEYYRASTAETDLYTTQKTLPNTVKAGESCTAKTRTDFGSSNAASGTLGGTSGQTNHYSEVFGQDRQRLSCHGYNQASTTRNGGGTYCNSITDWWGNQICDIGANIEQFAKSADSGTHPSDYITYAYFGTADGNHSKYAGDTLGNNAWGYAAYDIGGSSEGDKSQTTKTAVVVLKNTNTQGEKNPGWAIQRTQDVCTLHTWKDVSYKCNTYYLYGTHSNDRSFAGTTKGDGKCWPANNKNNTRKCEWTNNNLSPADNRWWNGNDATCYREHSDFKCLPYNGVSPDQSQINNSGNTSTATCRWRVTVSPSVYQVWTHEHDESSDSASSSSFSCDCDEYGNNCSTCYTTEHASCSASVTCDSDSDSCTASGGGSCTATCVADASYVDYTLTWTHAGWSTPPEEFSKKCSITTYDKTFVRSQSATTTYGETKVNSPTAPGSAASVTDFGTYIKQNCGHSSDHQYGSDNYCYETYNDFASESKGPEYCTRWKPVNYYEIKYLTTGGGRNTFTSRTYSDYQSNLYQYKCETNQPVAYPDSYVVKRYNETFSSQMYLSTERSNGAWFAAKDMTDELLPRAGEFYGVKVLSTYQTTRGVKPGVESHLQSFYDNYHNITTGPNNETTSQANYPHFNYNSGSYRDKIANPNYGYCSAKVAEPYGCEMSTNTGFTWDKLASKNTVNGVLQFTHSADTAANTGMTDHTALQGNMSNNWLSYINTTPGKCYFGPDDPLRWGEGESIMLEGQKVTLYGKQFGTENQYSAQIYITKKSPTGKEDNVLHTINLVGSGKCNASTGQLCTNYSIEWQPKATVAIDGTLTNKIYLDINSSYEDMTIEFRHSRFYGVAKYEQLLLENRGGGVTWGNDINGNYTSNGKYFNLVDGKPIKPLCSCDSVTFTAKGEVGWGTTEWEVE